MKNRIRFIPIMMVGLLLTLTNCENNNNEEEEKIADLDGNIYHTVIIGEQIWMVENLKTTQYNDSLFMKNTIDGAEWSGTVYGTYCWQNNEPGNREDYGALYNWFAVQTGKLCPTGYHVPIDAEWTILTDYLGGESVAGGKLKETGTAHWLYPNIGATNESGFTARPGGARNPSAIFNNLGNYGFYWTATEYDGTSAWIRQIFTDSYDIARQTKNKKEGFSVRCLKD